ncbi:MAG TPA: hypothetical protein VIX35_03790 [Vicinamibacterales bacterium]
MRSDRHTTTEETIMNPQDPKKHSDHSGATKPGQAGSQPPTDMNKKPGQGQPDPQKGQHGEKPSPGGMHQGDHKGQNPAPAGPGQKR